MTVGSGLAVLLFASALAQGGAAEIEALTADYLKLWNKHDAASIVSRVYRLEPTHPWSTTEGLAKEFDRLKAQGYSHSDTQGIKGCLTGADTGQVELRFSRIKTDGSAMPPKDRLSIYRFRKFPDGWRVIGMSAGDPAKGMECPSGAK